MQKVLPAILLFLYLPPWPSLAKGFFALTVKDHKQTADMFIPENIIREIREACSIVDVVKKYVNLKKVGSHYKGLCPFHSEKTPSFSVSEEKKFFHCFGCGASGDVFSFLMKHDNLSFQDAARQLAQTCSIRIPEKPLTAREKAVMSQREEMLQVNEAASHFFHHMLVSDARGKKALRYLNDRGIGHEICNDDRYALGYAPSEWSCLVDYLKSRSLSLAHAQKLGLVAANTNGGYYDRFRGRILFPIHNPSGRIIGFGGRIISSGEPKYLNSPESSIYSKRSSLYGLNTAIPHIQKKQTALIVEGYFDLLTLHQSGIGHAVAALGTALTPQQIELLRRHTKNIVTVFDADPSGQKAMVRSLEPFLKAGLAPRIVVLPQEDDPDTFVRKHGPEALNNKIEHAGLLLDYAVEKTIEKHDAASPGGKVAVCEEVTPLVKLISDDMERELYIEQISQRLGVQPHHLRSRTKRPPVSDEAARVKQPAEQKPEGTSAQAEKLLLKIMLSFPNAIPIIDKGGLLEQFEDRGLTKLGRHLVQVYNTTGTVSVAEILQSIEDDRRKELLGELSFSDDLPDDYRQALEDCIKAIRLKKLYRDMGEISSLLKQAEAVRDDSKTLKYQKLFQGLLNEKRGILQYKLNVQHL